MRDNYLNLVLQTFISATPLFSMKDSTCQNESQLRNAMQLRAAQ